MGMFDTIRSDYPIFGQPDDQQLQFKVEDSAMQTFWINRAGELYLIEYSGTQDCEPIPAEELDPKRPWRTMKIVPNGMHGRVSPCGFWGHLHVYPARPPVGDLEEKVIVFEQGKLIHVGDTTTFATRRPWYNGFNG